MEIDLLKIIVIGMSIEFVLAMIYVSSLLAIAKKFDGLSKVLLSLMVYATTSIVLVLPLLYLIQRYQTEIYESNYLFILIIVSYVMMIVPLLYYVLKVKIKELNSAGYFLQ